MWLYHLWGQVGSGGSFLGDDSALDQVTKGVSSWKKLNRWEHCFIKSEHETSKRACNKLDSLAFEPSPFYIW